jgi:hypothetical protein
LLWILPPTLPPAYSGGDGDWLPRVNRAYARRWL